MNRQQIDLLRKNPKLKDSELIETHISWVILTPDKVYKVKKNVQFSFLDFSTLPMRKFYCEQELILNQRLAPGLYEDVVAVNASGSGLEFGPYQLNSIDYAIRMRRVAKEWEMIRMLKEGRVLPAHMDKLAEQLATFHQNAKPDNSLFNPIKELDDFSDIGNFSEILIPHFGATKMDEILSGLQTARSFLRKHHQRFHNRRIAGFTVDGHGDLHVANIFLENNQPILFDCIEFNDELRKIDVLDEVAFLYVDLEASGRSDLAERFTASYQSHNRTQLIKEDEQLFDYYKCYRANVRLKVTAIKIDKLSSEAHADELIAQLHRYEEVYLRYVDKLKEYETYIK